MSTENEIKPQKASASAVGSSEIVGTLAHALAREAWKVLCGDADPESGDACDTETWRVLLTKLETTLRAHRAKRPNTVLGGSYHKPTNPK